MIVIASNLFIVLGSLFVLLAGVGLLRMPDFFTKMAAASKASTLGISLVLIGVSLSPVAQGYRVHIFLCLLFFLSTTPVAAHLLARASYKAKVPLYKRTVKDEWLGGNDSV